MKKTYEIWKQENSTGQKRYRIIGPPWKGGAPTEYGFHTSMAAARAKVKELEEFDAQDDWVNVEQIKP